MPRIKCPDCNNQVQLVKESEFIKQLKYYFCHNCLSYFKRYKGKIEIIKSIKQKGE